MHLIGVQRLPTQRYDIFNFFPRAGDWTAYLIFGSQNIEVSHFNSHSCLDEFRLSNISTLAMQNSSQQKLQMRDESVCHFDKKVITPDPDRHLN